MPASEDGRGDECYPDAAFVGRERELAILRAGLDEVRDRRGRLFLLVGEAGIGKSRTADEFVRYAVGQGAHILFGRCREEAGAPAYWPWIQILRTHADDREDVGRVLGEMGYRRTSDTAASLVLRPSDVPEASARDPDQARFRLFDAVITALKQIADASPLVLVFDDLHDADASSLALFQFLTAEIGGAPVLLLGTYRNVELAAEHPFLALLAALMRQPATRRIPLAPLAEDAVRGYLQASMAVPPPPGFVAAVQAKSEGNPLFLTELVRWLADSGLLDRPATVTGRTSCRTGSGT